MQAYDNAGYGRDFFILTSDNCPERLSDFYGYYLDKYGNISIRTNPGRLLDNETAGIFINIQTVEDKIIVQQDFFCCFGLYLFKYGKYWAVSNSFYLLARFLSDKYALTSNEDYIALSLCDMVPVSETETAIKEITELEQGAYLSIDIDSKQLAIGTFSYDLATVNAFSYDGIALIDNWHAKYSRIFRLIIDSGFVLSCDLSGGFDSRTAFSVLFKPELYMHAFVYAPNDAVHTHKEDFHIASKIASFYGIPIRNHEAPFKKIAPLEGILNSLKTKFFFHTQLYFKSHYFIQPVFNLNGGGGEYFRAMPNWSGSDFINIATPKKPILGKELHMAARNILERMWKGIKGRHNENVNDTVKIYRYTRLKNHFGRTGAESFLCNLISVPPMMDPMLYKLHITPSGITDRNAFFAFIISRFMPEILNVAFDKGRHFNQGTLNFVKKLNEEFPYQEPRFLDEPCISIAEKESTRKYALPMSRSATRYFGEIYKSVPAHDFIVSEFGEAVYQGALAAFDPTTYWGFWQITRLLYQYLLNDIIQKKEGWRSPYSQIYLPDLFTGRDACLKSLSGVAALDLTLCNVCADKNENPPATSETVYFEAKIISSPYSRNFTFKKCGDAKLLIAASNDLFPNIHPPYLVDIAKLIVFSNSRGQLLFEVGQIYCLGSEPYSIEFGHDDNEEISITVQAGTNIIWLCAMGANINAAIGDDSPHMMHGADNISNQYNH